MANTLKASKIRARINDLADKRGRATIRRDRYMSEGIDAEFWHAIIEETSNEINSLERELLFHER